MSIRIATSSRNSMRALTYQSVAAVDRYALIASFLSRHRDIFQKYGVTAPLSFLAEPVIDERSGLIDWYAEGTGPAKKLTDMTEAEQKPLKAQLHAFADALSACLTEDTQKKDRAPFELTRLALNHPSSTDDLFAVDGRPVLINWGFAPSALGQAPEDIMRMGHGAVPASVPLPETPRPTRTAAQAAPLAAPAGQKAATPRPAWFPGCLLPLLLAILLLWLLLSALGWLPSPLPASCFKKLPADTASERMRADKLLNDRERLLDELSKRAALCRPAVSETKPEPERQAVIPKMEEKPASEPEAKPEEKAETPSFGSDVQPDEKAEAKKDEALKIPDSAADNKDMSFLKGCWRSETDLVNDTGEKIVGEYCFDSRGKGTRTIYEKNGDKCTGSATARFRGKSLDIGADYAKCSRGRRYVPQEIQCTGSGDTTQCKGREITQDKKGNTWGATFRHK